MSAHDVFVGGPVTVAEPEITVRCYDEETVVEIYPDGSVSIMALPYAPVDLGIVPDDLAENEEPDFVAVTRDIVRGQ